MAYFTVSASLINSNNMKISLLSLLLICTWVLPTAGQKFISDSTCMIMIESWRTIDVDTSSQWKIDRSYDIIKMDHWFTSDYGLRTTFRKQTLLEKSEGETYDKFPSKNEIMEGYATDGTKYYPIVINWQYVDLNKDGKWDQFRLNWFEPNAHAKRTIFCTIPDSIDINIPSQ